MGYVVNFTDNGLVTADYINNIAAELGGGALAFQDDMTYGVDDLNGISAELISKGVTRGCGLSISGNQVKIAEGSLYMSDGRRIVIDTDGVVLDFVSGSINYVWFDYDAVTGFVTPRCTVEEPAGDDFVVVGRITADGAVVSKPDKAVMKNPFLGLHGSESFTKNFRWDGTTEEKLLWEIEPEDMGYQRVIAYSPGADSYNAFCGIINLADGAAFSVLKTEVEGFKYERGFSFSSSDGSMVVAYAVISSVANRYFIVRLRFSMGSDGVLRIYQRATESGIGGYQTTPSTEVTIILC